MKESKAPWAMGLALIRLWYIFFVLVLCKIPQVVPKYQSPCFKGDHRAPQDLRRRTEIIPVKDSHTRIKPSALASGHGRYITVTPERTLVPVGEWPLHIAVINL
jgi:hypothetical protein